MEFDKLAKARTRVAMTQIFFAGIIRAVPFEEAPWCRTAATDGYRIFWNREFFESLTVAQVAGTLIHEVLHIIWLHALRRGSRDPMIWNMACDYVINPIIDQMPKNEIALPPGVLRDAKYVNWSAYEVYADLIKNAVQCTVNFPSPDAPKKKDGDQDGDGQGGGSGDQPQMWGGLVDPTDGKGNKLSEAEKKEIESEINIAVESAIKAAKAIGKVPAGLEGLFEAREKPKINWHEYIQQWIVGHNPDDYTWSRPNRTMMANYQVFAPRVKSVGSGHGVLSIDCSGSVSDGELVSYASEIVGVIQLTRPDKLTIIVHDAVVQLVYEWNGEPFDGLKIKGRGGTCIAPVFRKVEELEDEVNWFIGFSDMEINDYPKDAPEYPVLWCATGRSKAPFGETILLRDRYE